MSKIIKVLDNNLIEIADYRCPEVIFKNSKLPPTLQDVKNETENFEWYCVFKETINPFELYAQVVELETENKKLWERHNEEHEQICKAIEYIKSMIKEIKPNLYDDNLDDLYILLDILKDENIDTH